MGNEETYQSMLHKSIIQNDYKSLIHITKSELFSDGQILNKAIQLNSASSLIYLIESCSK